MEILIAQAVGQLAVFGMLFRWLQVQTRDNKTALTKVYDKDETKEAIDLRIEPIKVGVEHIKDELKEMKQMIGKLLDEKGNK